MESIFNGRSWARRRRPDGGQASESQNRQLAPDWLRARRQAQKRRRAAGDCSRRALLVKCAQRIGDDDAEKGRSHSHALTQTQDFLHIHACSVFSLRKQKKGPQFNRVVRPQYCRAAHTHTHTLVCSRPRRTASDLQRWLAFSARPSLSSPPGRSVTSPISKALASLPILTHPHDRLPVCQPPNLRASH